MNNSSNQFLNAEVQYEQLMEIVQKVVSHYASKGSIPQREIQDAEMTVFEKFWNNREKIFDAFQGKSQLTTYCIAVANRMCCEFIRKEKKHWNQLHEAMETVAEKKSTHSLEAEKGMHFNNEVKRFSRVLHLFNGESAKLKLFLKYYLDIPLQHSDINHYLNGNNPGEPILDLLSQNQKISKSEKFEKLSKLVNLVEKKNIKSDSVRMWLNSRMDILLSRLNGNGISSHNEDSVTILMEMLHNSETLHSQKSVIER